jgi:hypothetical protein
LDDRKRFAVSECRERPDISARCLIANVVVNDISAIRGPPVGFFITFTAEQQLFAAAPTHRLDVNVFLGATARRTKCYSLTVGRPGRIEIVAITKGERTGCTPVKVVQPELLIFLSGRNHGDHRIPAIRREIRR